MVRESGIPATPPEFLSYLLPTFKLALPRRHSASSSWSPGGSPSSSAATTPNNSPQDREDDDATSRLARTAADTLHCSMCAADLAFASQIISKGFTGRHGRAYLVAPPAEPSLLNIRVGRSENRQLVTGWHVVADISCALCSRKLGWKYVDAKEPSQKYKVGKFILETERVVTHRSWNHVLVSEEKDLFEEGNERRGSDEDEIVFDSDDEDECEDVFAGVWDATTVAKRRSRVVARPKPLAE